jgi:hypothetical protein
MDAVKKWLGSVVDVGVVLVALGIVLQVVFGTKGVPFYGVDVVSNIVNVVSTLGNAGLAGLISFGFIAWLFWGKH